MNKNYSIIISCLYLIIQFAISSCDKNELDPSFKADARLLLTVSSDQGAVADSVLFSFAVWSPNLQDTIIMVTAQVMGNLSKVDREFKIAVDPTSTALVSEYSLPSNFSIPANDFKFSFPVTIKRTARLTTEVAKLTLLVVENENFKPGSKVTGTVNSGPSFNILWADVLTKPTIWDSGMLFAVGKWSKVKHQLIIDLTGIREYSSTTTAQRFAIASILLDWVNTYNASHPGNPLLDENGDLVRIGSNL